jgi:hypothetical protein
MVKKICNIFMIGIFAVIVITVINSEIASIPTDNMTSLEAALITTLPVMTPVAYALLLVGVIAGAGVVVTKILRWNDFGNRMKVAYTAKFGGENIEFNKEVDMHINAVKVLGNGFTKNIDIDWLKRMAKFVEIPFVIPEEEQRSEEEKTRDYGTDNKV